MILCYALYRKNRSPNVNLIIWVGAELSRLSEVAIKCGDQTAEVAARIGIEYCNCFTTIYQLETNGVLYNPEHMKGRKLDYQRRVFTLFDFIRDKYRDKKQINIDQWLGADEKRFDAGYLNKVQINTLRTLSSQLKELLAID